MWKMIVLTFVLLLIGIFSGCNNNTNLSGDKPPNIIIEVEGEKYEPELGSYCWELESKNEAECVDAFVPSEEAQPIEVQSGQQINLTMAYTPKPNEINLSQENNDVEVINNQFTASNEKGTYIYNYSVWWLDQKDKDVSNASADYGFILEIK